MWIVRLALRRPYTFVVMALAILLLGILAIVRMPADVFPDINIPVVTAIWTYAGVSPEEMADADHHSRRARLHHRRQRYRAHRIAIAARARDRSSCFSIRTPRLKPRWRRRPRNRNRHWRTLPPGIHPPNVIRYNAASVPILQLGLSSDTLSERTAYDLGYNFLRTQLANTQGASFPLPYGGKPRQIMVDLDPQALYARGFRPAMFRQR